MTDNFLVLISIGLTGLAAMFWPELRGTVGWWIDPQSNVGAVSIFLFLIYLILQLTITKKPVISASTNEQPTYVRVFVIFFFLVGLASVLDANPGNVPTERGLGAFFHVISLWGAAMLVADLVRAIYFKFIFDKRD